MKDTLKPGLTAEVKYTVDEGRTTAVLGADLRVYATPMMILDIERTCHELFKQHADAGEGSVGIKVEVEHLAPTIAGAEVTVSVKLLEMNGRKLRFQASVRDRIEELGRGFHERFVVETAKSKARIEKKRDQLKGIA
jgi:fluoroacetyl-CoA thioesterase